MEFHPFSNLWPSFHPSVGDAANKKERPQRNWSGRLCNLPLREGSRPLYRLPSLFLTLFTRFSLRSLLVLCPFSPPCPSNRSLAVVARSAEIFANNQTAERRLRLRKLCDYSTSERRIKGVELVRSEGYFVRAKVE